MPGDPTLTSKGTSTKGQHWFWNSEAACQARKTVAEDAGPRASHTVQLPAATLQLPCSLLTSQYAKCMQGL